MSDEGNALGLELDERGLRLRALGLWLDPVGAAPAAFVSHAHASGGFSSGKAIATEQTLAIARGLGLAISSGIGVDWEGKLEWPIERDFGGGTARLSVARAGHMLGAAQLIIDYPGGRFVYAGDWSAQHDSTHEAGEVVSCDELLVTSAFALPIFRFEPLSVVAERVVDWCRARLSDDETPVLILQNPGPAQAIAAALSSSGPSVVATEDVRRGCDAYEGLGIAIGPVASLSSARGGPRGVVIAHAGSKPDDLRTISRPCVGYASPWALLDASVEQRRANAAFVLSDHADYDGVVAMARATGANTVHVSRGDAGVLARLLLRQGIDADAFELPAIDERGAS